MSTQHVVEAMETNLRAPDKPVLLALALTAGQQANLDLDRLAFLAGYDQPVVAEAIQRLRADGVIYPVESPYPNEHQAVQFAGMPPEGA